MIIPNPSVLLVSRAISGNITNATVSIEQWQPKYAEKFDPQLPALSIEMDRWFDWSGSTVGQPNTFINTVFGQLKERTGYPMYLRVGGEYFFLSTSIY
jgi:hypothetical protein